ncbi:hypothetical protein GIB67_031812 [Kingdonia uniflora]|uniref:Cysteine protease n=1 Tax=Kingdonia uniflora TaxID=39325 RepID=A0A7J7L4L7_9MAGN|nr:hypothetical protein GIB67_031812 [Kingdonia uniflora]
MKRLPESIVDSKSTVGRSNCSPVRDSVSASSDESTSSKDSLWSSFFTCTFSLFGAYSDSALCEKNTSYNRTYEWTTALKKVVGSGSMRRLQERILGSNKTGVSSSSTSEIWLLGECYKILSEESCEDAGQNGLVEFVHDFSSKVWITYRKGFQAIGDSKFTNDVNWGCMLRSSQMLVAQALLFHWLGRSWRKPLEKPCDQKQYLEILELFGDSETSAFSIHNLLKAGKAYGLGAGSWIGPYATCRSWETLARSKSNDQSMPMAVYIVSGDEDGERGGAPVICIEDAVKLCSEFSNAQADWTPILLLVPLVLGLEKVNPRYIPSLGATFTFPQSLGILGGKPGASTYIIGVQDDKAFYLDPHEVQQVADVRRDDQNVDTSSYHCNVVRQVPLDMIDPSLAIGFYCRDKGDFYDLCARASKLADESSGAPLFTVTVSHAPPPSSDQHKSATVQGLDDNFEVENINESHEDDWQLL